MKLDPERRRAVIAGLWLVGLGILFATRAWWPGILFLAAIAAAIHGWLSGRPWYGVQAGCWLAFVGLWALMRFSLVFLLVGLGVSTILGALVKPGPFSKPDPFVDPSLE